MRFSLHLKRWKYGGLVCFCFLFFYQPKGYFFIGPNVIVKLFLTIWSLMIKTNLFIWMQIMGIIWVEKKTNKIILYLVSWKQNCLLPAFAKKSLMPFALEKNCMFATGTIFLVINFCKKLASHCHKKKIIDSTLDVSVLFILLSPFTTAVWS